MLSTLPTLALTFASAKVGGEVMMRLRQPAVVGELLAGVLLGPSVAGLVHPTEPLRMLAQTLIAPPMLKAALASGGTPPDPPLA